MIIKDKLLSRLLTILITMISITILTSCNNNSNNDNNNYELYNFKNVTNNDENANDIYVANNDNNQKRERKLYFGRTTTLEDVEKEKKSPVKQRLQTEGLPSIKFQITKREMRENFSPTDCIHGELYYSGGKIPTLEFVSPSGTSYLITNKGSIGNSENNEFTIIKNKNNTSFYIPSEEGEWCLYYNRANNKKFSIDIESHNGAITNYINILNEKNAKNIKTNKTNNNNK